MNNLDNNDLTPEFRLDDNTGCFVIENYNHSKPFSSFFPGIAGIWGIPMWVFYVNRGQCISSFGIEAKDKAIMEFQPANKAYRLSALQGFRTFIKVSDGEKTVYWEPFQNYLEGTQFNKKQTLYISAHDLTIEEINHDLQLSVQVNYFTLPDEPYSALVRKITVKNLGDKTLDFEIVDGMPMIIPYGMTDWLIKNMSRTVEAWVKVRNLENKAPYYQLNVEVADKPEVVYIREGNFYFSFDAETKEVMDPIVEASCIFDDVLDFSAPVYFIKDQFVPPKIQQFSNRTPSAFTHGAFSLDEGAQKSLVAVSGFARSQEQLNAILKQTTENGFIESKQKRNKDLVDGIRLFGLTKSSSNEFDLYSSHTFLDNILRGGLPISVQAHEGTVSFNVFSRKHGDLERDYNYFVVAPTFYSQGNGNYRDVNQNRRNDVWFNPDVRDQHIVSFFNLSQADGYNPLVVKGAAFIIEGKKALQGLLDEYVEKESRETLRAFLNSYFLPGDLFSFVQEHQIRLKTDIKTFFSEVLAVSTKQESADHGEGYWSDHWTYNIDLVESYLSLYPENLRSLLLEKEEFYFYHNNHYVLPRDQRYVLTDRGVRQYKSVKALDEESSRLIDENGRRLCTRNGEGDVYMTNLAVKMLCLIANKISTLDPSGIGVEMEAEKPNWYDALNGLPGLLGSSISETFEVKRFSRFLLDALNQVSLDDHMSIEVFAELADFISGLTAVLSSQKDPLHFWAKANDLKEHYRSLIRLGIDGTEKPLSVGEIKTFLTLVIERVNQAVISARQGGTLPTYYFHEVTEYKELDRGHGEQALSVRPLNFQRHDLPLFLEGYVHALRVQEQGEIKSLYQEVLESDLYDKKLKMYKVNTDLSGETEEIGRSRIFPSGWLENESIWLHMEYKFLLELLRRGLYKEFYENFKQSFVPFLNPEIYGRNILENSSFLVSSAHEDHELHGRGFVARLSGSTAEFMHIWLFMNAGIKPFSLNAQNELVLALDPALPGWLFTTEPTQVSWPQESGETRTEDVPENAYAFVLLGATFVVYHNPGRADTFGEKKPAVKEIHLQYSGQKDAVVVQGGELSGSLAHDVRDRRVVRIDVFFE